MICKVYRYKQKNRDQNTIFLTSLSPFLSAFAANEFLAVNRGIRAENDRFIGDLADHGTKVIPALRALPSLAGFASHLCFLATLLSGGFDRFIFSGCFWFFLLLLSHGF